VAVYNPCSLAAPYRADVISMEMGKVDVVGLVGTGRRFFGDPKDNYPFCWAHEFHWEVAFGWGRAAGVNRSCGGSLLLKKSRFPKVCVNRVFNPPAHLRGRIGFVLVSGSLRLLAGFCYFPPFPLRKKEMKLYRETCRGLIDFTLQVLHAVPVGTVPFLFSDSNTGFGLPEPGSVAHAEDAKYLGPCQHEQENLAGTLLRGMMRDSGLCAADTFFNGGATYWTTKGRGKHLDHIYMPLDLIDHTQQCLVWAKSGWRMQLATTSRRWDHWPLVMSIMVMDSQEAQRVREAVEPGYRSWQRGKLRDSVLFGTDRDIYFEALNDHLQRNNGDFERRWESDGTADGLHELLINCGRDAAEGIFHACAWEGWG